MQSTDIPTWFGILLFIVALGIVVVMAKWVAAASGRKGPAQRSKSTIEGEKTLITKACIDTY